MVRDRKTLTETNRRIAEAQRRAAELARIAELKRDDQTTEDASKLLQEIKATLGLMQTHREQLLRKRQNGDRT